MQIPPHITPGPHRLVAMGVTGPGQGVFTDRITIDVERTDYPLALRIEPSVLGRMRVGDKVPLRVIGTFLDGPLDLTRSSQTTYVSQSPNIATVDKQGWVTAVSPGTTKIVVDKNFEISVTVQASRD